MKKGINDMEIQTIRKCKLCKENIVLETNKFVPDGDKYYHYDCFVTFMESKKRNKLCKEDILKLAKELQEQHLNEIKDIINKNHLFKYLQRRYDLVFMPSFVFIKFNSVFDGAYKNLTEPVNAEDLLDMWIRKENYLDKNYQWKLSKGESMDGLGRMWYDLATILSKVGSYRKWKEENKTIEITKEEFIKENMSKIDFTKISNNNNKNKININEILEEI
jgi:hypothetical protein